MEKRFEGIIPAIVTPFRANFEVNYDAIPLLVNRLIEGGSQGLYVCGCTGEWWTLSVEERKKVAEAAIAAADGRVKTMVHVGSTATHFSTDLAAHAEKAGADAIATLPPRAHPYSQDIVWDFLRDIGESCSLPMYIYHLPQEGGNVVEMDRFHDAIGKIPTLAGVKFSSYRMDNMINLRLKARGRLNILSGCSEQLLATVACGAEGSVCAWYNYIPRLAIKIYDLIKAEKVQEARKHQDLLVDCAMLASYNTFGIMKWLMSLRGVDVGPPRPPTPYPTPEEQKELLPKFEKMGIFEWAI